MIIGENQSRKGRLHRWGEDRKEKVKTTLAPAILATGSYQSEKKGGKIGNGDDRKNRNVSRVRSENQRREAEYLDARMRRRFAGKRMQLGVPRISS